MFGIGFSEMLILAVIALLVFGPKRLPEIGSAVGKGLKEFKEAVNGTNTVTVAAAAKEVLEAARKDDTVK